MKTQKIKREHLKIIYDSVCDGWQKKIEAIILWNNESMIEIDETLILEGYNAANEKQKDLLERYFKIPKEANYADFDDILKSVGKTLKEILPWQGKDLSKQQKSQNAEAMLFLYAEVRNKSWKPNWKDLNQQKWFIWKEFSGGGGLLRSFYWGYFCYCPSGLYLEKKQYVDDLIKYHNGVLNDYFME